MHCEYEFCNFFGGVTVYEYIVNDCFVTFFSTIIQTFRVVLLCTYLLQNSYPLCQSVNVRGLMHLPVGSHHTPNRWRRTVHHHGASGNGKAKCYEQSHGDVPRKLHVFPSASAKYICHGYALPPILQRVSATSRYRLYYVIE